MKKLIKLSSLLLIVALSLLAVACSSYGKLEKAFTNAGYVVVENQDAKDLENQGKDEGIKAYYLEKKETISKIGIIILEFKETDDMNDFYEDNKIVRDALEFITSSDNDEAFYNSLVEAGYAKDNCLVLPITTSAFLALDSITAIVKGA